MGNDILMLGAAAAALFFLSRNKSATTPSAAAPLNSLVKTANITGYTIGGNLIAVPQSDGSITTGQLIGDVLMNKTPNANVVAGVDYSDNFANLTSSKQFSNWFYLSRNANNYYRNRPESEFVAYLQKSGVWDIQRKNLGLI